MASPDNYRIYTIKRFKKVRTICEPNPKLKELQQRVLYYLIGRGLGASKYAHGFVKRRNIQSAVKPHVGKKIILHLDLKDFFPSITSGMIEDALIRESIPISIITQIIDIACLNKALPIGAPTSPFLANLVTKPLDWKLASFCKSWAERNGRAYTRVLYTRYADNLIFSSNCHQLNRAIPGIRKTIECCGFTVNTNKTRIMRHSGCQRLLGMTVNKKMNVPRTYWRKLRAQIHGMKCKVFKGEVVDYSEFMCAMGKAAFVLSVNKERGKQFLVELKEIRKFGELKQLGQLDMFQLVDASSAS